MFNMYYNRDTTLFIYFFDYTSERTLVGVKRWDDDVNTRCAGRPKILVASKVDLLSDDKLHSLREQAIKMAKEIGSAIYIECSSKDNINVETIAHEAARLALWYRLTGKAFIYSELILILRDGFMCEASHYLPTTQLTLALAPHSTLFSKHSENSAEQSSEDQDKKSEIYRILSHCGNNREIRNIV